MFIPAKIPPSQAGTYSINSPYFTSISKCRPMATSWLWSVSMGDQSMTYTCILCGGKGYSHFSFFFCQHLDVIDQSINQSIKPTFCTIYLHHPCIASISCDRHAIKTCLLKHNKLSECRTRWWWNGLMSEESASTIPSSLRRAFFELRCTPLKELGKIFGRHQIGCQPDMRHGIHLSSRHGCTRKEMRHGIHQSFQHECIRKEKTEQNRRTGGQMASLSEIESSVLSSPVFPYTRTSQSPCIRASHFITTNRP